MTRRPLLAGNWKMFKTPAETTAYFEAFLPMVTAVSECDIVICPPALAIPAAVNAVAGSGVAVGGQNLYWVREGAFTGEVSGPMLKAAGAEWVIIGHSERRQFFGETDATVMQRTLAALEAGLQPIVCVGETLQEREAGRTNEVVVRQFMGGLGGLTPEQFRWVTVAYEPVWAIGTGKVATTEQAQDAHRFLREQIENEFGDLAATTRLLYGGSVKPDNARGLLGQPDIDGALVGGASLDPKSFAAIVGV